MGAIKKIVLFFNHWIREYLESVERPLRTCLKYRYHEHPGISWVGLEKHSKHFEGKFSRRRIFKCYGYFSAPFPGYFFIISFDFQHFSFRPLLYFLVFLTFISIFYVVSFTSPPSLSFLLLCLLSCLWHPLPNFSFFLLEDPFLLTFFLYPSFFLLSPSRPFSQGCICTLSYPGHPLARYHVPAR